MPRIALDTYIAEFSRVVEGFEIGEQRTRVSGLEDRMRSAKDSMEVVSQEVKELGWKFVTDVAVAGIALFLAFVVPALWAKLPDAATFGIDYMNFKRSGLQLLEARSRPVDQAATTDYKAIKAEYDLERTCLGQMVKLETTLHDSRPLVQEVTVKLGIFASVWAIVRPRTVCFGELGSILTGDPCFRSRRTYEN
ncbi:hypothetical protein J3R82DRAFT_5108 [Butyriboletus roseoflavus]|nr:hypothetical protein J3R82DRAFT_5108 [Butyriboletus roseoflavus]